MIKKEILEELIKDAAEVYINNPLMQQVSITQAILESDYFGNSDGSELARLYNNLFGIKGTGDKGSVALPTKEYIHGKWITVTPLFAHYASKTSSFAHHRALMEKDRYRAVWKAKSLPEAFKELWKAHYATNPAYPHELTIVWEKYVKPHFPIDSNEQV